ncbi:GSCOCG00000258001-RA-CDS [Cotesia congregata]|uniref:Transmembrane protein 186 n=1 Tax=Cotesia congregata TaxID=51543 RepID=A0A8J2HPA7_COTCN|nr:GSCOCG00000258001-RA-CDS [Cotesia congregata]CAG5101186.1 Similar to Tmem186: Transmembrane protein 186 (Rattus norvegicus) [Cotesia congregata]
MSLLSATCRRINAYRHLVCTSVSPLSIARTLSTAPQNTYDSKKFAGYKVLYNLETIKNISILNRLKYRMTIAAAVIVPGCSALDSLGFLSADFSQPLSFLTIAITFFFHGVGLFCNNVIGYIYFKPKSDDLKISYVNYWGKRIDIDADAKTVKCTENSSLLYRPVFNTVTTESTKAKLRLYVKGKVMDEKYFDNIFGIPF